MTITEIAKIAKPGQKFSCLILAREFYFSYDGILSENGHSISLTKEMAVNEDYYLISDKRSFSREDVERAWNKHIGTGLYIKSFQDILKELGFTKEGEK